MPKSRPRTSKSRRKRSRSRGRTSPMPRRHRAQSRPKYRSVSPTEDQIQQAKRDLLASEEQLASLTQQQLEELYNEFKDQRNEIRKLKSVNIPLKTGMMEAFNKKIGEGGTIAQAIAAANKEVNSWKGRFTEAVQKAVHEVKPDVKIDARSLDMGTPGVSRARRKVARQQNEQNSVIFQTRNLDESTKSAFIRAQNDTLKMLRAFDERMGRGGTILMALDAANAAREAWHANHRSVPRIVSRFEMATNDLLASRKQLYVLTTGERREWISEYKRTSGNESAKKLAKVRELKDVYNPLRTGMMEAFEAEVERSSDIETAIEKANHVVNSWKDEYRQAVQQIRPGQQIAAHLLRMGTPGVYNARTKLKQAIRTELDDKNAGDVDVADLFGTMKAFDKTMGNGGTIEEALTAAKEAKDAWDRKYTTAGSPLSHAVSMDPGQS